MLPLLIFIAGSAYVAHKKLQEMKVDTVESAESMWTEDRQEGDVRTGPSHKTDDLQTKLEQARRTRSGTDKETPRLANGIDERTYKQMGLLDEGETDAKRIERLHNSNFITPKLHPVTVFLPVEGRC